MKDKHGNAGTDFLEVLALSVETLASVTLAIKLTRALEGSQVICVSLTSVLK